MPSVTVTRNDIFGNGTRPGGFANCGVHAPESVVADGNFREAATGPGADPADTACGPGPVSMPTVAPARIGVPAGAGRHPTDP